jgi:hypothetical protein
MSEELNRDPLIDKLTRLTPASAGIDREAILFAAGRSSAPKASQWKIAASLLAISQIVTLGLWLTIGRSPQSTPSPAPFSERRYPGEFESSPTQPVAIASADSCGEMLRQWEKSGSLPSPSAAEIGPPQRVLSIAASYQILTTD